MAARDTVGGATTRLPWGDEIGGFMNFSEYRSTPHCLDAGETKVLARLAELLTRDDSAMHAVPYVLDVGANLGVTGLYLSHLFPEYPVICFEPSPTTFTDLTANMDRNQRRKVRCEKLAVCDSVGDVLFDAQPGSRANACISANGAGGISVTATTLDTYCAAHDINQVALLKIDTEGHKHAVLIGAQRLLTDQLIQVVYYEFCPQLEEAAGVAIGMAQRLLKQQGYESFRITDDGSLIHFDLDAGTLPPLCNLVAIPFCHVDGYRQLLPALYTL